MASCTKVESTSNLAEKVPVCYVELFNFEMEVANVLQVKAYDLNDEDKVTIIKNWLGQEGLQFIQTLTITGKDTCKNATGLFNVLKEKLGHSTTKGY